MPKFRIDATKTITFDDVVEAASLEDAEALVAEWITDDFTSVNSQARWDIEMFEE